jgi:hypothetical protein
MSKIISPVLGQAKHDVVPSSTLTTAPQNYWALLRLILIPLTFLLCASQAFAVVSAPTIVEVKTLDANYDGRIDQVKVTFSENVNVMDADATKGFAPLKFLNPKIMVVPGDYSAMDVNILVLNVAEKEVDTGMTTGAQYMSGMAAGNIFSVINGTELDLVPMNGGIDGAAPIIEEVFTVDGASGEIFVRFSEPVKNAMSAILTISDFNYMDNASGNAMSISAIGSDTDSSDGIVRLLLNSALTTNDLAGDSISPVGLMDFTGINAMSTPVGIVLKNTFSALVSAELNAPMHVGLGMAELFEIELYSFSGVHEVSALDINLSNFSGGDFTDVKLVNEMGNVLSAIGSPVVGVNNFTLSTNVMADHRGTLLRVMGNVMAVPVSGNLMVAFSPASLMVNGSVNSTSQPSLSAIVQIVNEGVVLPPPQAQINLAMDMGFTPVADIALGASLFITSFELQTTAANVNEVKVHIAGPADQLFVNSDLYLNGSVLMASGTISSNSIGFILPSTLVLNSTALMQVKVTMSATPSANIFDVNVDSMSIVTSANVVGSNISYSYTVGNGTMVNDPRALAYGPVPNDGNIDRVVVEYGHYSGGSPYAFYSSIESSNLSIVSANLHVPAGRVLQYVDDGGHWALEINGPAIGGIYGSLSEMNAEFGAGTYTLTVFDGMNTRVYDLNLVPSLTENLPNVTNPTSGAVIPASGVGVDWTYTGSANFFEARINDLGETDKVTATFPNNVMTAFLAKNGADFFPATNYVVSVVAVTVNSRMMVTSQDSVDQISVVFQEWQSADVMVGTSGAPNGNDLQLASDPNFVPNDPIMLGTSQDIMVFNLTHPVTASEPRG